MSQEELKPKTILEEKAELIAAGALYEMQLNATCEELHESVISLFRVLATLNPVWATKLANQMYNISQEGFNEIVDNQTKLTDKFYAKELEELNSKLTIKE